MYLCLHSSSFSCWVPRKWRRTLWFCISESPSTDSQPGGLQWGLQPWQKVNLEASSPPSYPQPSLLFPYSEKKTVSGGLLPQEGLLCSCLPLTERSLNLLLSEKCIVNEELKAATTKPPARKEEEVNPSLAKLRFLQRFILHSVIMILFK